jgi:hypothetical protein
MADYRFHTPAPVEIDVRVPAGDIVVETIDGDESFVEVEGDPRLVDETRVELQGTRLVVELRTKKAFGFSIEVGGFSWGNEKLRVRARIPHASAVSFTTASADMQAHGTVSTLSTKSASGDLTVRGTVMHDATIKTVSGDVHLDTIVGDLRVQSVSGDVLAGDVGGSIGVKSVSGDLRIAAAHAGEATLQSVSGDIELGVATGTIVDVDANSVSGDLESEVPLSSDPAEATGAGPTLVVRGKTVSGDFRLVRG